MGFPSLFYCVILPKPIILIFELLDFFRYAISLFFYHIGLTDSVEYCPLTSLSTAVDRLTDSVEYCPLTSLSTTVDRLTVPPSSAIKSRLRPVKFSNLGPEKRKHGQIVVCSVCLGQLNSGHEVRELGNCSHLFHRECIDKWVDLGKLTCPLCRALLLPNGIGGRGEKGCFDIIRWRNY